MTDYHGKKVTEITPIFLKIFLPVLFCAIFVFIIVSDFSFLPDKFGSQKKRSEDTSLPLDGGKNGKERDIVVNEKDLQEAYKKLLSEKREQIENPKDAEKRVIYFVELASGTIILANEVSFEDDTVTLTDDKGFVLVMKNNEITGIRKKIQNK